MNVKTMLLVPLLLMALLLSCTKKTVEPDAPKFKKPGVFVVNEGNFTTGNASLTWYQPGSDSVFRDAFYAVNKVPLGDVANYMTVFNNRGYIVINNSGVVYAIDLDTGEFLGKISGLSSPREILVLDANHAWVSDLYNKYITVVDLNSFETIGTISLHGRTSESMVRIGNKVFVNNWSRLNQVLVNNMVLVLDAEKEKVIDSIEVTREPNSMVVDANNKLRVLCSGGYSNVDTPALYCINPKNDSVESILEFADKNSNPFELKINGAGNTLWFLSGGIYKMDIEAAQIPDVAWVENGTRNFYSLGVRPDKESVYVSDALDYVRNGKVYVYNSAGVLTADFEAGIIPGYFCFIN